MLARIALYGIQKTMAKNGHRRILLIVAFRS